MLLAQHEMTIVMKCACAHEMRLWRVIEEARNEICLSYLQYVPRKNFRGTFHALAFHSQSEFHLP